MDLEIQNQFDNIKARLNALWKELLKVEEKLDKVIEFSETLQAKYLEDKLEKALKSGKLHLKFMKETEEGLKEAKNG